MGVRNNVRCLFFRRQFTTVLLKVNQILRWFQGLNWESLRLQTTQPPIVPNIKSKDDHSNFDPYPDDDDYPPEEFSGWDADF